MERLPQPTGSVNDGSEGQSPVPKRVGGRPKKPPSIPVWRWTDAVTKAKVRPLTKLVCLNIGRYLSDASKGWFITIKEMMDDTGMSELSLVTHLENAEKAQLIERKARHNKQGYRFGTFYKPRFPDGMELAPEPAEIGGHLDADPAPRHEASLDAAPAPRKGRLGAGDAPWHASLSAGDAPQEDLPTRSSSQDLSPPLPTSPPPAPVPALPAEAPAPTGTTIH